MGSLLEYSLPILQSAINVSNPLRSLARSGFEVKCGVMSKKYLIKTIENNYLQFLLL